MTMGCRYDRKGKVAKRYDRWSRFYDALDTFPVLGRIEKKWRLSAIESLKIDDGNNVLDVGTGSGLIIPWLAEHVTNGKIIGVDISEKMLLKAKKRIKKYEIEAVASVQKDDVEALTFQNNSFDRVIATFALTTIPNPEKAVKEMIRVLKEDGKMVILDTGKPKNPFVKIFYYPMLPIARVFGYTYFDRDIKSIIEDTNKLKITNMKTFFGGMVYCISCELNSTTSQH